MSVYDFMSYCIDESMMTVEVWSGSKQKVVWKGNGDEIPDEYLYAELWSFDVPDKAYNITVNIE